MTPDEYADTRLAQVDQVFTIDLETYYSTEFSLEVMPTMQYVRDPRFETIGVGVQAGSGTPEWLSAEAFKAWAAGVDWTRSAILAHNAAFDMCVLTHHFGIKPAFIYCTLSMGRALYGTEVKGSLHALSEKFGVGKKGDEVVRAKGKRKADFSAEELAQYGEYCKNDVALTWRLFNHEAFSRFPKTELVLVDKTVRWATEPVLVMNRPLLEAELAAENERMARLLAAIEVESGQTAKEVLGSPDKFAELLQRRGVEPPMKPSPKQKNEDGTPKQIYAFAKSDPGMQALLEGEDEEIAALAQARLAVKSNIVASRTQRFLDVSATGPFPMPLRYYGGHTGRYAGSDLLNVQNLRKGTVLRQALEAPDGRVILAVDKSQIEARVLPWLGGYTKRVELFRRRDADLRAGLKPKDFYCEVGEPLFGRPIEKPSRERDATKECELGLGYGSGWVKFADTLSYGKSKITFTREDAERLGVDAEAFLNGKTGRELNRTLVSKKVSRLAFPELAVHCAVTHYFVELYRTQHAPIKAVWDSCNYLIEAMDDMSEGDIQRFGPGDCLAVTRHAIILPNGMRLKYAGLSAYEVVEKADGTKTVFDNYSYLGHKNGRLVRTKIYGSLLAENITQALARIIMTDDLLICEAADLHSDCTVHDEILFDSAESEAEDALKFAKEVMSTPRSWYSTLPLNAEGAWAKSYGSCK